MSKKDIVTTGVIKAEVWQQGEVVSNAYVALSALAAEVDALSFKARAGKLPEIIRAIAEALK
jgi:hypothetical protein